MTTIDTLSTLDRGPRLQHMASPLALVADYLRALHRIGPSSARDPRWTPRGKELVPLPLRHGARALVRHRADSAG